ncbi:O-antigen ligase family protein [Alloyangia pacifica]|uniref:O-antigen ligase n=1 Tax=Alloyangia pacifica TaxID=311180 RepID=A0A1I6S9W7_9RHOB|nr:O-antigen ligase family protein [Alloyangia pacifica]SDG74058.1 O-antigen ligase [Alloyangia pacifica]SFS73765.1 O-antigen ligase [Alloyangia pacifica]
MSDATHTPNRRIDWRGALVILISGLCALGLAYVLAGRTTLMLALPVALLIFTVGIRFPMIALAGLIALIISNASDNLIEAYDIPSLAKITAPGLFVLLLARYAIYRDLPYVPRVTICCLAIIFAVKLVSATYALRWSVSVHDSIEFFKDAVVAILALAFMNNRRGFDTVALAATLPIFLICSLGLYQLAIAPSPTGFSGFARLTEGSGRLSGMLIDPNFFAAIVVFTIPLGLFYLLNARGPVAMVTWTIISGVLIAGLLATQSRGALIGLALGLIVLSTSFTRKQFLAAGMIGVLVVMLAGAVASDELIERFTSILSTATEGEAQDTSTEGRLASWTVAYNLFNEHPWFGVGQGNFKAYYQNGALDDGLIFRGEGRSTHSLYLELLTELGLVGLMMFLGIAAMGAVNFFRAAAVARSVGDELMARRLIAFCGGFVGYLAAMTFLQDGIPRFLWYVVSLAVESYMITRCIYADHPALKFRTRRVTAPYPVETDSVIPPG